MPTGRWSRPLCFQNRFANHLFGHLRERRDVEGFAAQIEVDSGARRGSGHAIRVETDLARRRAMIGDALRQIADDLPLVPLYRRTLTWVMTKKVHAVQWPNDSPELRWIRIR